jgi:predicted transcriptional regulator
MATATVKTTYSLDPETVRTLDRMARRWKVSRSEALRRAIRAAAERDDEIERDPLAALDALQRSMALTPERAREWGDQIRAERTAPRRGTRRR